MSRRRFPRPRGQNLVLLALTMLFLALMVTITLGLGQRIKENHELQSLADASAWSDAVMVARAYNNAAFANRLEVAFFVSQTADQSLISWTSYGAAVERAAEQAAGRARCGPCPGGCNRLQISGAQRAFGGIPDRDFLSRPDYRRADQAAGREVLAIQQTIAQLRNELAPASESMFPDNLRHRLFDNLEQQRLPEQIVAAAGLPGVRVVVAPGADTQGRGANGVSRREVDCDYGGNPDTEDAPAHPGLCSRATWSRHLVEAAMGSRGNPFVTLRGQMPGKSLRELVDAAPGFVTVTAVPPKGSGYFAGGLTHGRAAQGTELWADDHGSITVKVTGGGCTGTGSADITAEVRSNALEYDTDHHIVRPAPDGVDRDPDVYHTMGTCSPECPSVWVRTLGFNPSPTSVDAWGQPKTMVAVERDNAAQPSPWELRFKFPFSATGAAREWDGRGQTLHTGAADGLDVTRSVALGTGLAYYHRRKHWDEFPNLLNPFWRATLVPADVDRQGDPQQGGGDVKATLNANQQRWQRDAWDALARAGYKGIY